MTLSDPNPGFKVTVYLQIEYLNNGATLFRLDALALSVIAMATWLGGWVAVCHSRYCIKTTKPIGKLFEPSGSPIIWAFRTPYVETKFQG